MSGDRFEEYSGGWCKKLVINVWAGVNNKFKPQLF